MSPLPKVCAPHLVWFCALAAALLGGLGLAGWGLEIVVLSKVFPGFAAMRVPVAAGLVLAGATLAILVHSQATKRACRGVRILCVLVILLGALSVAENLLGRTLLFGSSLMATPARTEVVSGPERLAPSGGFFLILIGSALLVACPGPNPVRVQVPVLLALGATVMLSGGLILLSYTTDAMFGYRLWNHTGFAVHTAMGYVLLGGGLLALAWGKAEWVWSVDVLTTAGFAIGVWSLLATTSGAYNLTREMPQTNAWVSYTHEVVKDIRGVAASLATIESGRHAYLITGDEQLLQRGVQTQSTVQRNLTELRTMTAGNDRQQRQIDRHEVMVAHRAHFSDQAIFARQESDFLPGEALPVIGAGLTVSDHIRDLLGEMEEEEHAQLAARQTRADTAVAKTFLFLSLGGILSVTMLSLGLFFLNAGNMERKQAVEKARWLASFPERSPNPVLELDLPSGVLHYINPTAARLFPDLPPLGLEHPWLAGLAGAAAPLLAGTVEMVSREVTARGRDYVQTISCLAESRHLRIYSSDITAHNRAQEALHEVSGRLLLIQEEERRRIARELHDSTAQELAAIGMNLGRLQEAIEGRNPAHDNLLADSLALLTASSRDLRTLSYLLHPQLLDELGLAGALRNYVTGFAARSGLDVQLMDELQGRRFLLPVEMVLFRVAQESLTNVLRHSGSPSATIRLRRHSGGLELEVADLGRGLPPELLGSSGGQARLGVGIASMRERLRQFDGKLEFFAAPRGTIVRATVPFPEGRA